MTVSITVAPVERAQGWGGRMLTALAAWNREAGFADRLVALVREDNHASRGLFLGAGYRLVGTSVEKGCPALRFEHVRQ